MICISKYFPSKQAKMKIYCTHMHTHARTHSRAHIVSDWCFARDRLRTIRSLMSRIVHVTLLNLGSHLWHFPGCHLPLYLSPLLTPSLLPPHPPSSASPSVSLQQFSFNCILSHLIPLRVKKKQLRRRKGSEKSDGIFNPFRSDETWNQRCDTIKWDKRLQICSLPCCHFSLIFPKHNCSIISSSPNSKLLCIPDE